MQGSASADSDADFLAEVADGAGDFAFLVFLVGEFFVGADGGAERGNGFPLAGHLFEVGQRGVFTVEVFPELGLFVGELFGEAGNGFDEYGDVWTKLRPPSEVFFPVH
ncbi:MAG: hypothetical protein RIS92_211 [Verrucomicrobiota bacterium]